MVSFRGRLGLQQFHCIQKDKHLFRNPARTSSMHTRAAVIVMHINWRSILGAAKCCTLKQGSSHQILKQGCTKRCQYGGHGQCGGLNLSRSFAAKHKDRLSLVRRMLDDHVKNARQVERAPTGRGCLIRSNISYHQVRSVPSFQDRFVAALRSREYPSPGPGGFGGGGASQR